MKLTLKKDDIVAINSLLTSATITYGYTNYDGKRVINYRGTATNLHFDSSKKKWVVDYKNTIIGFRELLTELNKGIKYKTQSKSLKELVKMYINCIKTDDAEKFVTYLDNLGQKSFRIEDVKICNDEIEWLKDHVTNITARFPSKYKRAFEKAFPGSKYTICDQTWNYAFIMYFDTMEGIPESLLKIGNSLGNSLDYDEKKMCNTSYIWNLIKNYTDFTFGKRSI